jgi:hypothetical protein
LRQAPDEVGLRLLPGRNHLIQDLADLSGQDKVLQSDQSRFDPDGRHLRAHRVCGLRVNIGLFGQHFIQSSISTTGSSVC